MNRRSFILAASAAVLAPSVSCAQMFAPFIAEPTRAFIPHPIFVAQQCVDWCWAASCSMIFGTLGHPTDQRRVVDFLYDDLACAPVPRTRYLTKLLSKSWVDDQGVTFWPRIDARFDQENGVFAMDEARIVSELTQMRPLLYANRDHVMVVVEADFVSTPGGPRIVRMVTLDPSLSSDVADHSPYHVLTESERLPAFLGGDMMYLAAVQIPGGLTVV